MKSSIFILLLILGLIPTVYSQKYTTATMNITAVVQSKTCNSLSYDTLYHSHVIEFNSIHKPDVFIEQEYMDSVHMIAMNATKFYFKNEETKMLKITYN